MIENIEENIDKNPSLASKFIELDKSKKRPESEVCSLLNELKYKKIPAKLPSSNIFKYNV